MRGQARVVLAVKGVWEDGRHEILHYEATDAESTASWSVVLAALTRRGLDPNAVRMVVSDGTTGLPAAITQHLPAAQQQRCTVHKIRGLERQFCYRDLLTTDPTTHQALTFEQARRLRRLQVTTDAHALAGQIAQKLGIVQPAPIPVDAALAAAPARKQCHEEVREGAR